MKFILSLSLCLFINISFGQKNNEIDSLENYSYFIFGKINDNSIEQGTAFLIKKGGKIYLTSAAHVFNGWDYVNNKYKSIYYPDTLFLRVYKKADNEACFLPIDIRKLKISISKNFYLKTPDFYFLPINIPKTYKVFTINKFIHNYINPKKGDEIIVYGYPVNEEENDMYRYVRLKPTIGEGYLLNNYSKVLKWEDQDNRIISLDSIDYQISIINGSIRKGNSGSPAFFITNSKKKGNPTKIIYFAGLFWSANFSEKKAFLLKPEFIKNELGL